MEIINFKFSKNFAKGYLSVIKAAEPEFEYKGKSGDYTYVRFENIDDDCYYAALYEGEPVAFLYLEAIPDMVALEESVVWVSPEHRGRGLAEVLYRIFIENDGGILVSDSLHTEGGIALWNKFVAEGIFKVFAFDICEEGAPAEVEWDEGLAEIVTEPVTKLWVTEGTRKNHNYRLVAHK